MSVQKTVLSACIGIGILSVGAVPAQGLSASSGLFPVAPGPDSPEAQAQLILAASEFERSEAAFVEMLGVSADVLPLPRIRLDEERAIELALTQNASVEATRMLVEAARDELKAERLVDLHLAHYSTAAVTGDLLPFLGSEKLAERASGFGREPSCARCLPHMSRDAIVRSDFPLVDHACGAELTRRTHLSDFLQGVS